MIMAVEMAQWHLNQLRAGAAILNFPTKVASDA